MEIAQLQLGTNWSRQFVTLHLSWRGVLSNKKSIQVTPIRYKLIMEVTNPNFIFDFFVFWFTHTFSSISPWFSFHISHKTKLIIDFPISISNCSTFAILLFDSFYTNIDWVFFFFIVSKGTTRLQGSIQEIASIGCLENVLLDTL